MHMNAHRLQRGLSLVEVFVALLVLSVGLIALAKLQVDLVRGGADARARTIALSLAEEKVEDLRTFALTDGGGAWSPSNAVNPAFVMAWSYIDANTGGRLVPQATYSSALEVAGVRFTRTWAVNDRDFTNVASGITSRTKDVTVTVSWQNEAGATQTVNTVANVVEIPPGNVALASEPLAERPPGPKVNYTPGVAPEIISVPIDTGTGERETTKPLPDVQAQGDYTHEVRFDVVNYHLEDGQNVVDRREEFVTVNCRCALNGPGPGRTPARVAFTGNILRDAPGKGIPNKPQTGVVDGPSQQPVLCDICCRDHHDGPEETLPDGSVNRYKNPFDTTSLPHKHYLYDPDGDGDIDADDFDLASSTGDAYDEACRLKRVNGVFQVFQDWNLATILAMPENDLTITSIQDAYSLFVQNYVKNSANTSLPAGTTPMFSATTLVPGGSAQLSGRAIYVDHMPQNLMDFLNPSTSPPPDNFLTYVPFYEVNLTKLADWRLRTITPDDVYPTISGQLCDPGTVTQDDLVGKIACIANQAIVDETVLSVGLLQAYYRGTITAGPSPDQLDAQVYAQAGNTGLTGTFALSSTESLVTKSSEYRFTVDAGQAITGTINKGTASGNPWSDVSVTAVGACSLLPKTGNPSEKAFTCMVPSGWEGTVNATWTGHTVSASNNVFPPSTLPSTGVVSFVLIP
jgi:Tfp pilus assembly protein PilV